MATLKDLCELTLQYNKNRGPGKALGTALASLVIGDGKAEEEEVLSAADLGTLERRYGDFLRKSGLALRAVSKISGTILFSSETSEGKIMNAYARIDIVDWRKFVAYLQNTDDAEGVTLFLEKMLHPQIHFTYTLNDEVFLELAMGGEAIVGACERFNISQALELQNILSIMRARYLHEYLEVKRSGLLQKVGEGFGPSTWHTDANPDWYLQKWGETLELLKRASENSNAAPLVSSLREHLHESAQYARGDLKNVLYYTNEQKDAFAQILDDVLAQL